MAEGQATLKNSPASVQDHWYTAARQVLSPNFDDRPETPLSLIVVHNISLPPGKFGGPHIDQLFTNQLDPNGHPFFKSIEGLRVSSHILIRRDGEVVQYVPFNRRAWHAGVSQYYGQERCNDFSIGIELEGTDETPYTNEQYQSLEGVVKALWQAYPTIKNNAICGHEHIAPGRKTDPGPAFDWQRLASVLALPEREGSPWS